MLKRMLASVGLVSAAMGAVAHEGSGLDWRLLRGRESVVLLPVVNETGGAVPLRNLSIQKSGGARLEGVRIVRVADSCGGMVAAGGRCEVRLTVATSGVQEGVGVEVRNDGGVVLGRGRLEVLPYLRTTEVLTTNGGVYLENRSTQSVEVAGLELVGLGASAPLGVFQAEPGYGFSLERDDTETVVGYRFEGEPRREAHGSELEVWVSGGRVSLDYREVEPFMEVGVRAGSRGGEKGYWVKLKPREGWLRGLEREVGRAPEWAQGVEDVGVAVSVFARKGVGRGRADLTYVLRLGGGRPVGREELRERVDWRILVGSAGAAMVKSGVVAVFEGDLLEAKEACVLKRVKVGSREVRDIGVWSCELTGGEGLLHFREYAGEARMRVGGFELKTDSGDGALGRFRSCSVGTILTTKRESCGFKWKMEGGSANARVGYGRWQLFDSKGKLVELKLKLR